LRLTPRVGRLPSVSISLEEFLSFPCGYEDPPFTIPLWNLPSSTCDSPQGNSSSFSGSPADLAQHHDDFGSQSINWDVALFNTSVSSDGFLAGSSSLPLTSSSALMQDGLQAPVFPNTVSAPWPEMSVPASGTYLGDDSYGSSFTASGQSYNIVAMSSGMGVGNLTSSTPMLKDRSSSGSAPSPRNRVSSSPEQQSHSKSSTSKSSSLAPDAARVEKRRANTMAARRYRQKRVDQMTGLEAELKDVKTERDDLKVRCARLEGEVETLRALLRAQK